MSIYSKTISDNEILSLIPIGSKKILIFACNSCMNESVAYTKKMPLFFHDEKGELISASYSEAKRIANILDQNGYSTKVVDDHFCITPSEENVEEDKLAVIFAYFNPDVILSLSCKAGALGLRLNTKTPVKCITKQVGYLTLTYEENNETRQTVEELSEGIPLKPYELFK